MSELAFNINGEAFEVPANASGWRVRRMRAKGSPEVVYSREGLPLVLPIDAGLEELKAEVDVTGRYRLDLVDTNNKAIATAPSGYVQVNIDSTPAPAAPIASSVALLPPSDNIAIEALRTQAMIAQSVVERFPQMMEAAATLLRAADGAGLPARPPMAVDDDDDDEDDEDEDEDGDDGEPRRRSGGLDIVALLTPILPLVVNGVVSGKVKLPDFAALLDWRKVKPKTAANDGAPTTGATEATASAAPAAPVPALDLAQTRRFIEIQQALTPEEAAFARRAAGNLSPAEIATWLKQLSEVSLDEAVRMIRAHIAKSDANVEAGSAP
jgi:hypothetical protein